MEMSIKYTICAQYGHFFFSFFTLIDPKKFTLDLYDIENV